MQSTGPDVGIGWQVCMESRHIARDEGKRRGTMVKTREQTVIRDENELNGVTRVPKRSGQVRAR